MSFSLLRNLPFVLPCILAGCPPQTVEQKNASRAVIMEYPYEMASEQRKEFVAALQTLKSGDALSTVKTTLGPPFDEAAIRGKKFDDPVTGTIVTYYLKKFSGNLVNEKKDEYVSLVFDTDQKLVRMRTNIASLRLPC